MALNDVIINEGNGGLGRPLPGQDYVSGKVFYTDVLPSGFTTLLNIKQILSVIQAESLGILNDYSDETKSTGKIVISSSGATGDSIEVKFTLPDGTLISLGVYTNIASDSIATFVTGLTAAINALTYIHGFVATASLGTTVTFTAKPGLGIFPNTGTPYTKVVTGAAAGTLTQNVIPGVASLLAVWHYHIKEYFRMNPQGNVYVGFFPVTAQTWDAVELQTLQNFAGGIIRQASVYYGNVAHFNSAAGEAAAADAIQAQITILKAQHKPMQVVYAVNLAGVADFTTLTNLGLKTDQNCSAICAQDGAAAGFLLYKATGYSITCLGAVLGAISAAKVSESIEWVQKFNFSNGTELAVPALSNGVLISVAAANLLTQLNTYRHIFLRTFTGVDGTYANDSHCCVATSSSYAFIEDNRTSQKAERLLYAAYVPQLGGPLTLNGDGTLSDTTLAFFISVGGEALDQMVRDGELSAFQIKIDSTQNVQATNTLTLTAEIIRNGVARNITITLSPVNALS